MVMPAHPCDRCGVAVDIRTLMLMPATAPGTEYHLCQRCLSGLFDYLRGK